MKKLSLVVATMLASQSIIIAEDVKNDWTLNGNIRVGFIADDNDVKGAESVRDLAVGGSITILTPKIDNNFQIGTTLYTSQPLFGQKSDGFLTENNDGHDSYSYIGEAYITGTVFGKTSVLLGKKVIDTPFADSDDIGMTPNSFEVYLVKNNDFENITLTAGRVLKMAGVDASVRGEFTDMTKGDGVSVMAINYSNSDLGLDSQAWYYHLDDFVGTLDVGIIYLDATYSMQIDEKTSLDLSGQFARFQHINGDEKDGSVIGFQAGLGYEALSLGLAYNQASGDIAPINGFGGGPFYTSANTNTMVEAGQDSTGLTFSAGYDINDEISISTTYSIFTPDTVDSFSEIGLGAGYSVDENLAVSGYFATWNDSGDIQYTQYYIFMNYGF